MNRDEPISGHEAWPTGELIHTERRGRVKVIRMIDAARRNVLSTDMSNCLVREFAAAERDSSVHVILLAGLPTVFSLGASRADLLAMAEGMSVELFENAVSVPLHSDLPVVAALQGHAISGGLLLGAYADVTVLSERSYYGTNFLRYGFTPNAGATYLLAARLGQSLADEMLLTAQNYQGMELRRRSISLRIAEHTEVEAHALQLAERIATAPRRTLTLLKRQVAARTRAAIHEAWAHELTSFELLLSLPDTRHRIKSAYPDWSSSAAPPDLNSQEP